MLALTNLVRMISVRLNLPIARLESDRGATAVEYGLMVAAIAAVIIALVFVLGTQVQAAFQTIVDAMPGGTTTP